ncbi:hypothetical protein P8C59_004385 [Phyllachora maydis]|uniref:Meiosis-specific APC/C activator protein AMA1 n=1 Tax=Phyllachora maydis TaxID=1825666 RepID=A0AAD9MAC5_9PEZI|nr:hypothetical protein P8C59_004385 [Phyllachora maydis]
MVPTEDLLVGDDQGIVYFFSVEWPDRWEVERFNWPGVMRLRAKISVHSQQICGLAWSANGSLFATGGNDNLCYCFESSKIINARGPVGSRRRGPLAVDVERGVVDASIRTRWPPYHINFDEPWTTEPDRTEVRRTSTDSVPHFGEGDHKQRWTHGAAVKAIAFCPWQEGLLATGGGSNDKCIHFYHSTTGTALATISVSAQVTGLIWSTTAREIAATFGYTQPEHPMRIAVFAWPACTQVASIPWAGNHRALYAVPYPSLRRPATAAAEDRRTGSVTTAPPVGSIVVAASDGSVKFHEIWPTGGRSAVGGVGMLGGSAILDCLEGIDPEGDVIR